MTDQELGTLIVEGLISTGVEGAYDSVSCSTAGDYPSMGCSQWEGLNGGRGDILLSYLDGGDYFANRTYSDIVNSGELSQLQELLGSEQGQIAQRMILMDDCVSSYIGALRESGITNDQCIVYASMWCPTSTYVVSVFVTNRISWGYDMNNLQVMHQLFRDEYATAADCEEYSEGYTNRANNIYNYVAYNV